MTLFSHSVCAGKNLFVHTLPNWSQTKYLILYIPFPVLCFKLYWIFLFLCFIYLCWQLVMNWFVFYVALIYTFYTKTSYGAQKPTISKKLCYYKLQWMFWILCIFKCPSFLTFTKYRIFWIFFEFFWIFLNFFEFFFI